MNTKELSSYYDVLKPIVDVLEAAKGESEYSRYIIDVHEGEIHRVRGWDSWCEIPSNLPYTTQHDCFKYSYKGKDVENLSREELFDVIDKLLGINNKLVESFHKAYFPLRTKQEKKKENIFTDVIDSLSSLLDV